MIRTTLLFLSLGLFSAQTKAQGNTMILTLDKALQIANDSSLQAFRAKNLYMASYWNFRNYGAQKLPGITLNLIPASYNRNITSQFVDSAYRYFPTVNFMNRGNLTVSQNIPLTGGSIYLTSDLTRFENIEPSPTINYNATWFSVGYRQPVFGFNHFKWLRKTEPLKYEIARRQFIQSREEINIATLSIFFNLAVAQLNVDIARHNYATADTLYKIGQKRFMLASIDKGDLLTLRLERINSVNDLSRAESNFSDARDALVNRLRLENTVNPVIELPRILPEISVNTTSVMNMAKQNNPFYLGLEYQALDADMRVESAKVASRFNASFDVSMGYNQNGFTLAEAYTNPSEQQILTASISIPLLDWGARRSQYLIARNERDALKIQNEQSKQEFEQDIIRMVNNFNLQARIVESSKEASIIAEESFNIYKQRFIKGSVDVHTLGLQQNKRDFAQRAYLYELQNYWHLYYSIRKITLHDFVNNASLEQMFDAEIFKLR